MPFHVEAVPVAPEEPSPAVPACVACDAPSECEVWEHRVCYACAADWAVASPTYGDIERRHGPDFDAPTVYRAFTRQWLAERRARFAA